MKKISLWVAFTVLLVVSCSDETTVYKDQLQDDISVEASEATLQGSISFDNAGVLEILSENQLTGKTAKNSGEAGDYPLTLVAQVAAPSYTGAENLGATHIDIDGDYAYVSYNTVEDGYAGAIDIINVTDPNNPRVTGRLYYTNADINALAYDNGFVYAVGGFDSEKSTRSDFNSFVAKIAISNGSFNLGAGVAYGFQEGFNATDIKIASDKVFVTSGGDGLLTMYDKNNLETLDDVAYTDLRSIALADDKIAVLDASTGVKFLDFGLGLVKEIGITSDFGPFSKRTIDLTSNHLIVSEGSKGAGIYDANSGTFLKHLPILINPEGVADQDIVTNAVASNEDIVLMANGGAGLSLSEDQGSAPALVGIIELKGSINFVASKGDYIFAASGKKGLQIIKLNRPNISLVERCSTSAVYTGSANLVVNSGDNLSYRGAKQFNSISVNGNLLLCGSWTVSNEVAVNANALFEMNGTLVVGRNSKRRNIVVAEGATFRVEGNLTVYGDIILQNGATIEFIGTSSVANVFGVVTKNGTASVKGTFDDVRNKF